MYYLYFTYTVIIALLMLLECQKKDRPKWWAIMVLFAPVTTPWFIFKSRKESGIILFIVFLMTFSAVGGTEFFLYKNYMEKNRYSDLSPEIQQMIHHIINEHPDLKLLVQTNPAFCCPGLITEAMAQKLEAKINVPIVSITYDVSGGSKNSVIIPFLKESGKKNYPHNLRASV